MQNKEMDGSSSSVAYSSKDTTGWACLGFGFSFISDDNMGVRIIEGQRTQEPQAERTWPASWNGIGEEFEIYLIIYDFQLNLNMRQFITVTTLVIFLAYNLGCKKEKCRRLLVRPLLTAVSCPTRLTIWHIVRNIYEMPIFLPFIDLVRFPRISTSRRKSFMLSVCQPMAMPSMKVDL